MGLHKGQCASTRFRLCDRHFAQHHKVLEAGTHLEWTVCGYRKALVVSLVCLHYAHSARLIFQGLSLVVLQDSSSSSTFVCVSRESHNHAKALYRRAMAHKALGNFEQAAEDLTQWKQVEPSAATEADAQIARLKVEQKAANANQKQQNRNFFDRK